MIANRDTPVISYWSTNALAPQDRWESVVQALGKAIVPISVSIDNPHEFEFQMSIADLDDGISILHQIGTSHRSGRGRRELARSDAHTFHFLVNLASSWTISQNGDHRLSAGEGILIDSAYVHDLALPAEFEVVHVKMQEAWLRRWVGDDLPLAGRRFALQPGFGSALNFFAAQLCPRLLSESPITATALADKFGALVAMASRDTAVHGRDARIGLCDQIRTDIAQRCADVHLTPADIGRDLHLSEQELHSALVACGLTFADVLLKIRCESAVRMLHSPSFASLSAEEISSRAGFADAQMMYKCIPSIRGRR